MELYKLSAIEIRDLFLKKEISAKEIVLYFLKRIEKTDSKLNCFLSILKERALKKADELDNKKSFGKLAAIPVVIKDNINIKNEIMTCGSKILKNYKSVFDATCIKLLEKEDAIIIGKTNLDEFAMGSSTENSAFFTTKNPWDLDCVAGGSSGGSAAAIAAKLSLLGLGSDTGASVRQPAAFCSVIGFKPTYGRVSRYGLTAFASSLDHIGSFATTVKDIALIQEVIAKPCNMDATNIKLEKEDYLKNLKEDFFKNAKIGVAWNFLKNLNKEVKENFENSIKEMKNMGAKIIEIDLDILKYSIPTYYILATAEASTNLARFDGINYGHRSKKIKNVDDIYDLSRDEGFGNEVKRRIMLGTYVLSSGFKDQFYKKAQKVRYLIIKALEKVFETCSIIVLPTAPFSAFKIGSIKDPIQMYMQDCFTSCCNFAGLPAISVPSGFDKDNKPLGIQLIGAQLKDSDVLSCAFAFENRVKYFKNIPPLFDREFI